MRATTLIIGTLIMLNLVFADTMCSSQNMASTSLTLSNTTLHYGQTEVAIQTWSGGTPPYGIDFFIVNASRHSQYLVNTDCYFNTATTTSTCTFIYSNASFSGTAALLVLFTDSQKPGDNFCTVDSPITITPYQGSTTTSATTFSTSTTPTTAPTTTVAQNTLQSTSTAPTTTTPSTTASSYSTTQPTTSISPSSISGTTTPITTTPVTTPPTTTPTQSTAVSISSATTTIQPSTGNPQPNILEHIWTAIVNFFSHL